MRWLTGLLVIILSSTCFGADSSPLVLGPQIKKFDLHGHFTYLRDPGGHLSLDDVAALQSARAFRSNDDHFNFGITTDTIWLRLEVQRTSLAPVEWWLELAPAYIGEATIYQVQANASASEDRHSRAGISLPLSSREFKARYSTFKIHLPNDEPQIIYLKLRSSTQFNIRGYLWQPATYAEEISTENLLLGIYYGAFAVIVFFSALRYLIAQSRVDFWWLVYLTAEGLIVLRMNGLTSRYLFPEMVFLSSIIGIFSLSAMLWAGSRFSIHAFSLNKESGKFLFQATSWLGYGALIAGFARLLNLEPASTICLFSMALMLCLLGCVCSWRFLASGDQSARFYFVGIWFMTLCVILVTLRNFGIVPAYEFIDYVWQSNLIIHAGLISVGMVLTHREKMHERRQATDFRAIADINFQSSVLQKKMLAMVSHEFRNFLSMLSISMHTISKRKDLPGEVTERHKNITNIHYQMRRVIDNFLLEERIQNADIKLRYRLTDVGELVNEAISLAELNGRNNFISCNLSNLPQFLWLDDGILRLVLSNLLDNAMKYSAHGGRITVQGHFNNEILRVSVADDGIGMNAASLSRIFEPYFKVDALSDGMGIGLCMVKMMLQAHEGDLLVVSELGKGSTLNFWLKVKVHDELQTNSVEAARPHR